MGQVDFFLQFPKLSRVWSRLLSCMTVVSISQPFVFSPFPCSQAARVYKKYTSHLGRGELIACTLPSACLCSLIIFIFGQLLMNVQLPWWFKYNIQKQSIHLPNVYMTRCYHQHISQVYRWGIWAHKCSMSRLTQYRNWARKLGLLDPKACC